MSRAYIDPRFGDEVRGQSCEVQLLWYVLLTHPFGQLVPGLIRVGIPTLVDERGMPEAVLRRGVDGLKAAGLLVYDDAQRLIQLPRAPGYFPKPGPDLLRGWWRQWQTMPESPLKYAHVECLRVACSLRGKSPIVDVWTNTFGTLYADSGSLHSERISDLPLFNQVHGHPPRGVSTPTDPDTDPPPDRDRDQDRDQDQTGTNGKVLPMPSAAPRPQRLWERQEQLRAEVFGTAPEKPTSASLARVAACLEATGASDEQVEAVLVEFKREAVEKGTSVWFDGRKNWSVESFKVALAKAQKQPRKNGTTNGHYKPKADVKWETGLVDLNLIPGGR